MGIIGIAIALFINAIFASVASDLAEHKGFSKRAWFHACFWLPPFGYLMVIAMLDLKLQQQNADMIELQKQLLAAINRNNCVPSADTDTDAATDVPDPFTN